MLLSIRREFVSAVQQKTTVNQYNQRTSEYSIVMFLNLFFSFLNYLKTKKKKNGAPKIN